MPSCSCCSALLSEFKRPMFDLVEHAPSPTKAASSPGGSLLAAEDDAPRMDVERTFSPRPRWAYVFAKAFILAWVISIMYLSISQKTHPSFWLAYLTHWGFTVTVAYMLMSTLCAIFVARRPLTNPDVLEGGAGLLIKTTWALMSIAVPGEVIICILFWVLEFDGTVKYVSIMVHGGAMILVSFDAFVLSRTPLRMKQFIFLEIFAISYILWSVIHAYSGIGNPYNDGVDQTDDAIYDSLAWKNNTTRAVITSVGVVFVANPIVFLFCRFVSRLPPRRLCEKEEAFKASSQQQSFANDEEAAGGEAVVY